MDPGLATRFMQEDRLPNFQRLAERGVFRPLDTSNPSIARWVSRSDRRRSVAHGIYDFITRDRARARPCCRAPRSGREEVPTSVASWSRREAQDQAAAQRHAVLEAARRQHIQSIIQRVPITFPPEPFRGCC
jgi:predicted AlkP superfamily phosphohydrolase/phosphomutase